MAALTHLAQLPHWVYRMFDDSGELLYIGFTYNPEGRLYNHQHNPKSAGWIGRVRLVSWTGGYPTRFAAHVAERRAIADEQPTFNRDRCLYDGGFA